MALLRQRMIIKRFALVKQITQGGVQGTSQASFPKSHLVWDYNMVGVAVAMVISTMHEKSCIDLHNPRKFEKS